MLFANTRNIQLALFDVSSSIMCVCMPLLSIPSVSIHLQLRPFFNDFSVQASETFTKMYWWTVGNCARFAPFKNGLVHPLEARTFVEDCRRESNANERRGPACASVSTLSSPHHEFVAVYVASWTRGRLLLGASSATTVSSITAVGDALALSKGGGDDLQSKSRKLLFVVSGVVCH